MKNDPRREEKPSLGRRIMKVAAPVAIIGGTLAYRHITRSGVPTQLTNPAEPKLGGSLFRAPRQPLHPIQPTGNPRSRRWLSDDQIAGRAPIQKPGIFHEGSGPSANAPLSDIAKRTASSDALTKEAQAKARLSAKVQRTVQERQAIKDAKAAVKPATTATTATPAAVVAQPPVRKVLPNDPPAPAAEAPKVVAPKEDLGPPLSPDHPKNVAARKKLAKQVARMNGKPKKEPTVIDVNKQQAEKQKARRTNKAIARAKATIAEIKGKKKELAARLRTIRFNSQNEDFNNMLGVSDRITTAYRKGRRIVPWIKRGTQAAEDIGDIASGKKPKDPFWNKAWAKSALIGASIGAPILAARKINKWHRQDVKYPNSVSDMSPKLGRVKEHIVKAARGIDEKWINAGLRKGKVRQPILTSPDGPFFASKIKNPILLKAVLRTVNFASKRQAGLLPFKGYSIPARVEVSEMPAGVQATYASPDYLKKIGSTHEGIQGQYGKRIADRAVRGGAIATAPSMPGDANKALVAKVGYGSEKNVDRRALRHELVHSIKHQKRGGPPKGIIPLMAEEIAAYRKSNRSLKGMPQGIGSKIFRAADAVTGVVASTKYGAKAMGIKPWKLFASKIKNPILLSALKRAVNFEYADALDKGWDLRDARGRSARVYAPGSRKRVRREKNWDEKTDNIRLVRNIAIAGALAGAGGVGYGVYAGKQAKRKVLQNYRKQITARGGPKKLVKTGGVITAFPKGGETAMSAKVRLTRFEKPAIQRITSAITSNLPEREPTAPEQAYAALQKLPPRARRGVLRYIAAGGLASAGVVGGLVAKRPKTGALIGGLAAGLTL